MDLLNQIGPEVSKIYVVDDACPEGSGKLVAENTHDPRVLVITNTVNLGVGGAVKVGYQQALAAGADIIVKMDGDGQMDPRQINNLCRPLQLGAADYAKGNRFYSWQLVKEMPRVRLIGNGFLSFITKFSTGYWNIADPTNGFTAISQHMLTQINLDQIDNRYFFESDMLFHLYLSRAVVADIPMKAIYANEKSNLSPIRSILPFMFYNATNLAQRILATYLFRDFNIASLELIIGVPALLFGILFGAYTWGQSYLNHEFASSGTVMLAAMPIIVGMQLILSFINYDISQTPKPTP
jgi:glycosyltransferase involved in cell wall biosynthesis